jgi:UDP-3-O-[3-hydroxymyristoyl] glucosamine N-acyltransferase
MGKFSQKGIFVLQLRVIDKLLFRLRNFRYQLLGMRLGNNTYLPKIYTTWPHQVSIGSNCLLERGTFFKFDGIWKPGPSIILGNNNFLGSHCEFNIKKRITVGNDCLIASGCKFIDHDHGISLNELMRKQHGPESEIIIGNNVWLGVNAVILKGITIGDGAIIAAGAVVTKSILPDEIWAGIPAKKIGHRNL